MVRPSREVAASLIWPLHTTKIAGGALAFLKDDGAAGVGNLHGDLVEALDGLFGQVAEEPLGAVGTLRAALGNLALLLEGVPCFA
jgi:hypothetical protein